MARDKTDHFTIDASDAQDRKLARAARRALAGKVSRRHPMRISAGGNKPVTTEIPLPAARLLLRMLDDIAAGHAVTLVPSHAELTTQQAADLLGVSRPFLIKMLEDGLLPHHKVGTHRRLRLDDLQAYKRRIDTQRQATLDELARETQLMNIK